MAKRKKRKPKKSTPESQNKMYSAIISELLAELEKGNVVWRKPWRFDQYRIFVMNPLSDNPFTGRNVFVLAWAMMVRGYANPAFATLKQVEAAGGEVIETEVNNFVRVVRFSVVKESYEKTQERLGRKAENDEREVLFLKPNYYRVYNLKEQTTGLEDRIAADPVELKFEEFEGIEKAEKIVDGYTDKPKVSVSTDGRAYYVPSADIIGMPPQVSFETNTGWYGTLFHELAHSTGDPKRLGRDFGKQFGNNKYAKEELVAEITAAILAGIAGISADTMQNNAAYINGWHEALKKNPKMLLDAMRDAEQAVDYMLKTGKFAPKDEGVETKVV